MPSTVAGSNFGHIYIPSAPRELKCVIVYLARVIPAFVMYCVNGASCSSLLVESTDSIIIIIIIIIIITTKCYSVGQVNVSSTYIYIYTHRWFYIIMPIH